MSFEGHYEVLCERGHLDTHDALAMGFMYGDEEEFPPCRHCGAKIVWDNLIDDTNEYGEGSYMDNLIEKSPAQNCTCHCGNVHCTAPATYEFPPKGVGRRIG